MIWRNIFWWKKVNFAFFHTTVELKTQFGKTRQSLYVPTTMQSKSNILWWKITLSEFYYKQDSKSFWSPWPRDMYVRISMSICETMLLSLRHLEMIWDILIFFEILWNALRCFETLWDALRRFEMLCWYSLIFFDILWSLPKPTELLWVFWFLISHCESFCDCDLNGLYIYIMCTIRIDLNLTWMDRM